MLEKDFGCHKFWIHENMQFKSGVGILWLGHCSSCCKRTNVEPRGLSRTVFKIESVPMYVQTV